MARQGIRFDKRRLAWFLISGVLMFASAYYVARWLGVVGTISGWTGLPQHESEIPRLQVQARFWATLAPQYLSGLDDKSRSTGTILLGSLSSAVSASQHRFWVR